MLEIFLSAVSTMFWLLSLHLTMRRPCRLSWALGAASCVFPFFAYMSIGLWPSALACVVAIFLSIRGASRCKTN